jgi:putative transposase
MENKEQAYPSDLSNEEWELIMPHLPIQRKRGLRQHDWRILLNAMFYIARSGVQRRMLPNDFPAWQTVYYHFAALIQAEVWQTLNQVLSEQIRLNEGPKAEPSAALADRDGAIELLDKAALLPQCKLLKHFWTDGAYNGAPLTDLATQYGWTLEMVKPPPDQKGFQVLPRRWVVERTFAWAGQIRRLAKNYERKPYVAEAFIYLSMCRLLLVRLA